MHTLDARADRSLGDVIKSVSAVRAGAEHQARTRSPPKRVQKGVHQKERQDDRRARNQNGHPNVARIRTAAADEDHQSEDRRESATRIWLQRGGACPVPAVLDARETARKTNEPRTV
jgi:hypothetical protein